MLVALERPLVVAPMAGGPTTTGLVVAAAAAGGVGFLAAGYKSPEAVRAEIAEVRAAGVPYGLNIFVPTPTPPDPAPLLAYREALRPEAQRYGATLPPLRLTDEDHYPEKVRIAVEAAVPLVSFTFGVPGPDVVAALRGAGCAVLVTVTTAAEAGLASAAGADGLVVQAGTAGGHAATMSPAGYTGTVTLVDLVREVAATTALPIIAAGGVGTAADVREALAAGAVAVQVGTAFLLADEAGTRPVQRAAMRSGRHRETTVTRAFTGQPARALRNRFTDAYSARAPIGYPAVHHLTAPIRAAAAARGDAEALNLWAGTGHRHARSGPAGEILRRLCPAG